MAQTVLDVVAEDPQVPHVSDQVQPAAVQEHRGYKRYADVRKREMRLRPGDYRCRHNAEMHHEAFETGAQR